MLSKRLLFIFLTGLIIFQLEAQYNQEPWWKRIQKKADKISWWQKIKSDKNEVVAAAKSYKERRRMDEEQSQGGFLAYNAVIKKLSYPEIFANSKVDMELNSIGSLHVTPMVQTSGDKEHYDRVAPFMKMRPKAPSEIQLSPKRRRKKLAPIHFEGVGASSTDRLNRPTEADRIEKENAAKVKMRNSVKVKRFNKFFKSKKTYEETIIEEKKKTGNFLSTWLKRSVGMKDKVVEEKSGSALWSDAAEKFPIVYVQKEEFMLTPKINERIEADKIKEQQDKREKAKASSRPYVKSRSNKDAMSKKIDVSKLNSPILSNAQLILDQSKEGEKKSHDIAAFLTKPIKKMFAKKEKPKVIDDKLLAIVTRPRFAENELDPIVKNKEIPAELLEPKVDDTGSIKKDLIIKKVRRFDYAQITRKPEGIVYPKKKKHFNSISDILSRHRYDKAQRRIK